MLVHGEADLQELIGIGLRRELYVYPIAVAEEDDGSLVGLVNACLPFLKACRKTYLKNHRRSPELQRLFRGRLDGGEISMADVAKEALLSHDKCHNCTQPADPGVDDMHNVYDVREFSGKLTC